MKEQFGGLVKMVAFQAKALLKSIEYSLLICISPPIFQRQAIVCFHIIDGHGPAFGLQKIEVGQQVIKRFPFLSLNVVVC